MPIEVKKDYRKIYEYILSQASKDNLPEIQKQRYLYMLDKINELEPKVGFDEAVKQAYSGANISYAREREKEAAAAGDTAHVAFFQKMRGHALTMTQKGQNIATTKYKRPPGYNPANVPPAQRLGTVTGRRVHSRRYELLIFVIAGVLCFYIPPIFGLPPLTYLAAALIVFIPLYSVFASQGQVVESLGGGRITREAPWQIGSLMAKSFCKIMSFILIIFQFYVGFTVFRLITIAIAFLFYFSMPMHYRTSQPYTMIEAWFRMLLGLFIAYLLATTFSGFGPASSTISSAFLFMGLAFFVTLPIHIPDQNGVVNISFLNNLSESREFQMIERLIFLILMLASLFSFSTTMSGDLGDFSHIIFYLVGGMALFTGFSTGPEARPALGIIMILIMSFILSSTYAGYAGQALFGFYWPQIQSFGDTYLGPLNTVWAQVQASMGDALEMMTCPQCYYQKKLLADQAKKSVIMTGGTPMSIEIGKFELIPSMPGTLEPNEPTIGNMELDNQGQFTSGKIDLEIWTTRVNATELKEYADVGMVNNLYCTGTNNISNSADPGKPASCLWEGKTYPTEMRSVTFKLQEGSGGWNSPPAVTDGKIASACQDNSNASSPRNCECFCWISPCVGGGDTCVASNTTYKYSGTSIKVNANLTYTYVVNVSLPITIMNSGTYLNKLQAREINVQDFTSEYTGGPVKATIFTPKQPARTDVPFLFVASIYNDGSGELVNITNFTITVYNGGAIENVSIIGTDFRTGGWPPNATPNGCGGIPMNLTKDSERNFVIRCKHNPNDGGMSQDTIKPGKFKRISFYIYPNNSIQNQKTVQIIGWADYTYRKTTSQTLTVANAPPQ